MVLLCLWGISVKEMVCQSGGYRMRDVYVQRNYKDTLFRMLFKEKERLLSLYNGLNGTAYTDAEKQKLRLSDAFEERQEEPELELTVTVYNINPGNNKELMEVCHPLKEYAQYVEMVRKYAEKLHFREAVEKAVDECIKRGILRDFLIKNRAEAIEMCIFEFDEEKYLEMEREYAYRDGFKEGRKEGKAEGEGKLLRLQKFLIDTGRSGELGLVITDQAYREQLYQTLIEGQCTQ